MCDCHSHPRAKGIGHAHAQLEGLFDAAHYLPRYHCIIIFAVIISCKSAPRALAEPFGGGGYVILHTPNMEVAKECTTISTRDEDGCEIRSMLTTPMFKVKLDISQASCSVPCEQELYFEHPMQKLPT